MFKTKKEIKRLEQLKMEIQQEKSELLKIKEILEDKSPKIDISNVYIFEKKGFSYIVQYHVKEIVGTNTFTGRQGKGYESKLIDIFNHQTLHSKTSEVLINRKEQIVTKSLFEDNYYVTTTPIIEVCPDLLTYADRQVPLYVLQQLFYQLNNVDVNAPVLKKNLGSQ